MFASRLSSTPIDHIVAETAAFPLASEEAFRLAVTELDPRLTGTTASLWRDFEREGSTIFRSYSVDEVTSVRDRVWFRDPSALRTPLHIYLRRLAQDYLRVEGTVAVPKPWGSASLADPPAETDDLVKRPGGGVGCRSPFPRTCC